MNPQVILKTLLQNFDVLVVRFWRQRAKRESDELTVRAFVTAAVHIAKRSGQDRRLVLEQALIQLTCC